MPAPLPAPRLALVVLTFAAAFACYIDRVGFPIVYTAIARDAWIPKTIQGSVHSAFYNGYTATQVPGGALATRIGGQKVIVWAFALWGLMSALTPSDGSRTRAIWWCRVGVGGAMGTVFPSMHSMLAQAIPTQERNRAVSFMTSGMYFGSAFAMVAVPVAMRLGGAAFATTATGCCAFAWLLAWNAVNEKMSILRPFEDTTVLPGAMGARKPRGTPWGGLLTSPAVLVIMLNNFTFHYAFFILMSWMPTFYEQKLGLDAGSYTWLKMIPYLVMGTCSNVGGIVADKMMSSKAYSPTYVRKLLNTIGFVLSALALWSLPLCTSVGSAAFVSSVALGALAVARGGYAVNHMDVAPRLAGVLMGMSNGCGAMAGMIGPWFTGLVLDTARDPWVAAFNMPGYLCVGGAAAYLRYATAEQLFD
jgi:MFS family permease